MATTRIWQNDTCKRNGCTRKHLVTFTSTLKTFIMSIETFENLNLDRGDTVNITRKDGTVVTGEYLSDFDAGECSFLFRSFSKPAPETIKIRSVSSIARSRQLKA
jgi:formylmethanofuran dehydrogenase subunit D